MSFVQNFSVSQTLTASNLIITDTSVGTDASIVDRRIFLQKADGTYLTPSGSTTNYIDFPLSAGSSITLNILDTDYSILITVQWLYSSNVVQYFKTTLFDLGQYAINFSYQILQTQVGNPQIVNDNNFWGNLIRLYCDIFNANTAVTVGNDQYSSQFALDDASYLRNNQNLFF